MIDFGQIAHELLLKLPPETAHAIGKIGMRCGLFAPGRYKVTNPDGSNRTRLFDFELDNPFGLAAGFDKNGWLVDKVQEYGFGWDEVGSITWEGGKGNKKPRLFRLWDGMSPSKDMGCLLNRMGLNGNPADIVIERLKRAKNPFAVNIAKTHNPKIMGDKAIEDMCKTYKLVTDELDYSGKLIYVAINISCPNTSEGKTFEDDKCLDNLLSALEECEGVRSRLLKLSPTLTQEKAERIVEVADDMVDGYICGNTKPTDHPKYGKGGVSGWRVRTNTLDLIKIIRALTDKVIIGCGGIETGTDILEMEGNGANLFQAFNGFVLGLERGPRFAHRVLNLYHYLKANREKEGVNQNVY